MIYLFHVLTLIAIYALIALAYSVPVGYAGLLNLGQIGLVAVGAYTAAILTAKGIAFPFALLAAGALTGLAGFLLALPARRIRGDYYALFTLGFLFVANAVILNWTPLTNGPFGISGIRRPEGFMGVPQFFLLSVAVLVPAAWFIHRVTRSPFGRALEAIRDDELAAESLGKPAAKLKLVALTLSAAFTGVGGGMLAFFIQFINPQIFWLDATLYVVAALVLGGLASFEGTLWGTAILFGMLEGMRFLPWSPSLTGPLRLMGFSMLLLLVVLFRPRGIMGRAELE